MKVACGSGDAQTMCVTSDDNVWSWGDGDYGKLGHNVSESCKVCTIKIKIQLINNNNNNRFSLIFVHISYLVKLNHFRARESFKLIVDHSSQLHCQQMEHYTHGK